MILKTLQKTILDNMCYTSTFIFEKKKKSTSETALAREEQLIRHFCNPRIVDLIQPKEKNSCSPN